MYVVQFLSYTCATEHVLMCWPFWREGVGVINHMVGPYLRLSELHEHSHESDLNGVPTRVMLVLSSHHPTGRIRKEGRICDCGPTHDGSCGGQRPRFAVLDILIVFSSLFRPLYLLCPPTIEQ